MVSSFEARLTWLTHHFDPMVFMVSMKIEWHFRSHGLPVCICNFTSDLDEQIAIDPIGRGLLVGGEDTVAVVEPGLGSVTLAVAVVHGLTRIVAERDNVTLLLCGTGTGQPRCAVHDSRSLQPIAGTLGDGCVHFALLVLI
jgi:hypothetical protein